MNPKWSMNESRWGSSFTEDKQERGSPTSESCDMKTNSRDWAVLVKWLSAHVSVAPADIDLLGPGWFKDSEHCLAHLFLFSDETSIWHYHPFVKKGFRGCFSSVKGGWGENQINRKRLSILTCRVNAGSRLFFKKLPPGFSKAVSPTASLLLMSGKQLNTEAPVGIKIDFVVFKVFFFFLFLSAKLRSRSVEICVSDSTLKQLLFLDIQPHFGGWPSPVLPVAAPDARKDPLLGAAAALFQRINLHPSGLQR